MRSPEEGDGFHVYITAKARSRPSYDRDDLHQSANLTSPEQRLENRVEGLETLKEPVDRTVRTEHAHTTKHMEKCHQSRALSPGCGASSCWQFSVATCVGWPASFPPGPPPSAPSCMAGGEDIAGVLRNICPCTASCLPACLHACPSTTTASLPTRRNPHPRMTSSQASPASPPLSLVSHTQWGRGAAAPLLGPWDPGRLCMRLFAQAGGPMVGCASTLGLPATLGSLLGVFRTLAWLT